MARTSPFSMRRAAWFGCAVLLILSGCTADEPPREGAASSARGDAAPQAGRMDTGSGPSSTDSLRRGEPALVEVGSPDTVDAVAVGPASDVVMTDAERSGADESPEPSETEEDPAAAEPGQEIRRTSPSGLRVVRAYICRGIEESEPTEAGRSFLPKEDGVSRLCCFSEIAGPAEPDSIWHVWYWGDREMGRVGLEVRGPSWRTWSRKQVLDEWQGEWHVDIVDDGGFLLHRLDFTVE